MSKQYAAALEAHNAAQAAFRKVRDAYRALDPRVGDNEFFAARAEMDKADAAFALAYQEEAEAPEIEAETSAAQPELFSA